MGKKFEFSEEDKNLVKQAVKSLEKESSGEIVVYFARSSDEYQMVSWKIAVILGGIIAIAMGVMSYLWMLPEDFTVLHVTASIMVSALIGYYLPLLSPLIKLGFVADHIVDHRVLTKARDIFLQEQIFDTIDRTGILIYISEMERRVQVIGDEGINSKIEPATWSHVVQLVVKGIVKGNPAQGIVDAISKCKSLLLEHGFVVRDDNENELTDDIRIED